MRAGLDLLTLAPPELLAVLTTYWMDWLVRDEDVRKAHARFIAQLAKAATPNAAVTDTTGGTEDNPFPGIMRTGAASSQAIGT